MAKTLRLPISMEYVPVTGRDSSEDAASSARAFEGEAAANAMAIMATDFKSLVIFSCLGEIVLYAIFSVSP